MAVRAGGGMTAGCGTPGVCRLANAEVVSGAGATALGSGKPGPARLAASATSGGGAITAGWARGEAARSIAGAVLGGGGTTEGCGSAEARRSMVRASSGGGGTTGAAIAGSTSFEFSEPGTGTGPGERVHATRLGTDISCASLTLGGVTMVWVRLSASGGTEMISCGAYAGSALRCSWARGAGVLMAGRYSEVV